LLACLLCLLGLDGCINRAAHPRVTCLASFSLILFRACFRVLIGGSWKW
jgi:hypothetical protein